MHGKLGAYARVAVVCVCVLPQCTLEPFFDGFQLADFTEKLLFGVIHVVSFAR